MSDLASKESTTTKEVVLATDTKESLCAEIETIIKRVVNSIGRHSNLAYEVEGQRLKVNALSVAMKSAQITKKLEDEKLVLERKTKELQDELKRVTDGISTLATKYQSLYEVDIQYVRTNLESGMEKFSHILSKDTLERINQESTRIQDQVQDNIATQYAKLAKLANDTKTAQDKLQTKVDTVEETVRRQLAPQPAAKLDPFEKKLASFESKMADQEQYLRGMVDGLTDRVQRQSSTMNRVSSVISNTIKEDRADILKRLNNLSADMEKDQGVLEELRAGLTSLRSLMDQHAIGATTPSSSSSPSLSTGTTELKNAIDKQELKLQDLQRLVNQCLTTSNTTSLTPDPMLHRLDHLEKTISYLKTKIQVMEPQYQLAIKESQLAKEPVVGEKRPRPIDDENDQIQKLDFKLTSLIEYIHQFRTTVLNPDFPQKLDQGLQDMEACLQNHEMFIAYLVDPVAAAKTFNLAIQTESNPSPHPISSTGVSPALLNSISKLVEDATMKRKFEPSNDLAAYMRQLVAEHTDPLRKKIEDLEAQLARQK